MDQSPDIQPMAVLPGRDGIERLCWKPFLNGPDSVTAALDIRLRGAHGVTLRDVLLLELLTRPDRQAHRICALAQTLGVSPSRLATQVRRLEGRGLVTRRPSRRDPRGMLPRITGEGNARLYAVLQTCGQRPARAASTGSSTGKRDG
ncbi:MarR family transcriptional regulator [Mycolicibacter kumamotonensis]